MRKTVILTAVLLAMFLLSTTGYCWVWEEIFRENTIRFARVDDHPTSEPDQAASKFISTDDDVSAVRLAICDDHGFPVHYHVVFNPVVNTGYDLITTQYDDLYGYEASMTVTGGSFMAFSQYVRAKIIYPY